MLAAAAESSGQITAELVMNLVFQVTGGLGIFLLGMKYMSEGMQAIAGQRLRRMIGAVTDNRFAAVGTGTFVTCVVQSSSITTVLVVGFTASGLMALHQSIGVVMGANIGTTITGWILVLKIGKYGLPILGGAAFVYLFSKVERRRFTALAIMGFGMVFFGLLLMKNGFKPVREVDAFREAFEWFDAGTFSGVIKCVLIGALMTAIVQSSSATLGITIALATQGVIGFETAAALVLGENIGTTITAGLAAIGTTTTAKRAAFFHILFNLLGATIMVIVFRVYIEAVATLVEGIKGVNPRTLDQDHESFATDITFAIATAHTIFNLLITSANLPFLKYWARLLVRLVPEKEGKEIGRLGRLDMRLVDSPAMAIERSRREIVKMGDGALKMMRWTDELMDAEEIDEKLKEKVFRRENVMDNVQEEVIRFLTDLLSGNVPHSVAREGRIQLRVADETESITDYISGVLKCDLKRRETDGTLTVDEQRAIDELHAEATDLIAAAIRAFERDDNRAVEKANSQHASIVRKVKEHRSNHLQRLSTDRVDPVCSMQYTRQLLGYRKISDHALNIAEAVAAEV